MLKEIALQYTIDDPKLRIDPEIAAKVIREFGRSAPPETDAIAFTFHAIRCIARLSVHELSQFSNVPEEEIIQLELGAGYLPKLAKIAESLVPHLKISETEYKEALLNRIDPNMVEEYLNSFS